MLNSPKLASFQLLMSLHLILLVVQTFSVIEKLDTPVEPLTIMSSLLILNFSSVFLSPVNLYMGK